MAAVPPEKARVASLRSWELTPDRAARTRNARAAFRAKLARQADPGGVLPPNERERRTQELLDAHYARMRASSIATRTARTRRQADPPTL